MGKNDKMRGLPSILSLFRNEFSKFNNKGARMLDSIYHMTVNNFCNRVFGVKTSEFTINLQRCYRHNFITLCVPENL